METKGNADSGTGKGGQGEGVQITITVNGPGEVACWLFPLLPVLRERLPAARIVVALVPCVFSTGAERELIRSWYGIDAVLTKTETMALVLWNRLPSGLFRRRPGFVLHLGGDCLLSWLLSKRLGQAALAYVERRPSFSALFSRIFFSGFGGKPAKGNRVKQKTVGDMMVDAALMRCPCRAAAGSERIVIGLYPGSRDYLARFVLPFYAAVSEVLAAAGYDIEWQLVKSDFLPLAFLRSLSDVQDGRPIEGVKLIWREEAGKVFLLTPAGVRIGILTPAEAAARIKLALTLPGSNTAELSVLGVPMVVTIPSWQAERIPWPGLAGHIGRIPWLGKYLKRGVGRLIYRRMGFAAHPNRRAKRMVVPELVGHISSQQVAEALVQILQADQSALEKELKEIMGPPGATRRLMAELSGFLEECEKSAENSSTS